MPTYYLHILAVQSPFIIGVDVNNRTMWSMNFNCQCRSPVDKFEQEIAKVITDAGLGVSGTSLFIGPAVSIPAGAGPFILLHNTGGAASDISHDSTKQVNLSIQIVVYSSSYETGRVRAWAIWNVLDGKYNVTLSAA